MGRKITHNVIVLNHLIDHGYITEVVARNYGVKRLASRMNELKNAGVPFESEDRVDDLGNRYRYYYLSVFARHLERVRRQLCVKWNMPRAPQAAAA